jgi:SPP1 family predicted phage head-tail adaptor
MNTGIGQLRDRVEIQRAITTDDGAGGQAVTKWQPIASIWAEVLPLAGNEGLVAEQITALQTLRIRTRYRSDFTPKDRLVWRGKTLQIHALTDVDGRKKYLALLAGEVQGEA